MEFNPKLTKTELYTFLTQKGIEEDDAKKIKEEKVDGETFQDISESDLKEIGVKLGTRKKILKIIQNLKAVQNNQTYIGGPELQDIQIVGGDSYMSNSLVFDLIAAGTSCTVLPTISSTKSLSVPSTESLSVPSTKSLSSSSAKCLSSPSTKRPGKRSSLAKSLSFSPTVNDCSENTSEQARITYADPQNINVQAMLEDHASGKKIVTNLKTGKGISRSDINEIVRIVVRATVDDLKTLYPTSEQKHNLAKAIVRDIPELKSNRDGVEGYEQFYDPRNNSGSLEWRLKTMRLALPASKKKRRPKSPSDSKEGNPSGEEDDACDEDTMEKVPYPNGRLQDRGVDYPDIEDSVTVEEGAREPDTVRSRSADEEPERSTSRPQKNHRRAESNTSSRKSRRVRKTPNRLRDFVVTEEELD